MPLGSLLGGVIGAGGAAAAGSAAGAAGIQAYQNAQTERARNWANISPWYGVGSEASNKLAQAFGLGHFDRGANDPTFGGQGLITSNQAGDRTNALADFQASPGYQWRTQQGINALDRSAASRGMVQSGAQTRAVQDYGQNQASQEWGNYINALSGLSGAGMNAALGTGNTNASLLNTGIGAQMQGEMGRASSYSTAANALANGISGASRSLGSLAGYGIGAGWFDGLGGAGGGINNLTSGFSTSGVPMSRY